MRSSNAALCLNPCYPITSEPLLLPLSSSCVIAYHSMTGNRGKKVCNLAITVDFVFNQDFMMKKGEIKFTFVLYVTFLKLIS